VRDLQHGFWIGWLDLLTPYTHNWELQAIIADIHTLQLTVTHALRFSGFTIRVPAIQITLEVLFSQTNSFLAISSATGNFEDSSQFNSSAPKLISRQAGISKLNSIPLNWTLLYNHFARITQKTQSLSCWEVLFRAPLHSNGSYSTVPCIFTAAGMCLRSRCLAIKVYFDFAIPAFGRHVTVFKLYSLGFIPGKLCCFWSGCSAFFVLFTFSVISVWRFFLSPLYIYVCPHSHEMLLSEILRFLYLWSLCVRHESLSLIWMIIVLQILFIYITDIWYAYSRGTFRCFLSGEIAEDNVHEFWWVHYFPFTTS
jgi:hypothetical protein